MNPLTAGKQAIIALLASPTWMRDAACREQNPDLFDLADSRGEEREIRAALALNVCLSCPVRRECLTMGLTEGSLSTEDGLIWGGVTPAKMRALRRQSRRWAAGEAKTRIDGIMDSLEGATSRATV